MNRLISIDLNLSWQGTPNKLACASGIGKENIFNFISHMLFFIFLYFGVECIEKQLTTSGNDGTKEGR